MREIGPLWQSGVFLGVPLWLRPQTQENPYNGQNVRSFLLRTPIFRIVPVSRAYKDPPLSRTKSPLKTRRGGEHRRGEGSETFLERKLVLRRFPEVS